MLIASRITFCVALWLAPVAYASVQSQGPSPSIRESVQPPQTQAAQSNSNTTTNQRGTDQTPLVVKVLPTPESGEQAAADAKREDEKAANDRRLSDFTGYLFDATVALAIIAFFQLTVFGWQGIQLARTVAATKESADALMSVEGATFFVVAGSDAAMIL
jgi:hypothetical protein